MDRADLKIYYNRCNDDALRPTDPRYVDIDAMVGRPRGHSWVERLAGELELSDSPKKLLITGLRGTGKSTELLKLEQQLGQRDGANQLIVLVDANAVLDLANEIDVPDILTTIVHATERKVLEAEGKDPEDALADGGYLRRLWTWLVRTDIELGKFDLGPAGLVAEMKTRPTLRQRIRATLVEHTSTFRHDVCEELVQLEHRAQQAGYSRITVIFDSLEQLRGLSTNWKDVLKSAEQVFGGGAPHLQLPIHAVYTVPPALLTRRTDDIAVLPMVKLFDRDGSRHHPGFAAMRELVERRIPKEALVEILGKVYEPRIDDLIGFSGGHPRLVVQMLRWLLLVPQLPVSQGDIARLFAELRERYRAVITIEDLPWLRRVHERKELLKSADHLEAIDRALTNNVIFRYANADVWYDLHPSLIETLTQDDEDD